MIPHRSGDEFVEAVRLIVVPLLQPFDPFNPVERSIVVMDNWEGHYHPSVRALIEGAGARLVFLPAYAPHLNPIEEAFEHWGWATSSGFRVGEVHSEVDALSARTYNGFDD